MVVHYSSRDSPRLALQDDDREISASISIDQVMGDTASMIDGPDTETDTGACAHAREHIAKQS